MNMSEINKLIKEKKKLIIKCNDFKCDDICNMFNITSSSLVNVKFYQQRIGFLVEIDAQEEVNVTEIIAQPLSFEEPVGLLTNQELQSLMLNNNILSENAIQYDEGNAAYYVLYARDGKNEAVNLASSKIAAIKIPIKKANGYEYFEIRGFFKLYCNRHTRLDSYTIRINVPQKNCTIIEEGELAISKNQEDKIFYDYEFQSDLSKLHSVGWRGAPISKEYGISYEAAVYSIIKKEDVISGGNTVNFRIASLELRGKEAGLIFNRKQLENELAIELKL